jgi:pimeloyl-ACP methyl ester carboxylesterase
MEQQIRFCNTPDGARIAYATLGQGPHLVYLGACITHLELEWEDPAFRNFFEKLGRHHTIVRFDRRGVGLSDREMKDFSMKAELQDLESIIDHLQLRRLAILGAHRGGPLAVAYTAKYPQSVTNLILYGTYARGQAVAKDEVKESLISLIRAHWGLGSKTLADIYLPGADSKKIKWFDRFQRESATAEFTADSLIAVYQLDVVDLLSGVRIPTVVIHRQKDRIMPFSQGRELAARIPNARFVSLEGNIHAPWLGDSDSVMRIISESLGDPFTPDWRELLDHHHELVRREFSRFQGQEIDAAGDGFFATFDRPAKAIQCASAISDSLQEIGLEIRAGLHMGECEVREDVVSGIAVHIGARVMAKAGGGEILATNTVKDMVAGSDIRFQDRGMHDLKGIPGEWRLYAIE